DQAIDSLAVLPFQNRSGNADSEYLSDGLAETLIYRLSQLPDLKVSPTSSVFRYKGTETDPLKVGTELGVQAVMSGRLTQRGEQLTISVELVDVRHNKTLWGEQYERKLSELLAMQREIAAEITNKLQLKLSGEGAQKLSRKDTDNPEAYQLYLLGRHYWNKRTEENLKKAIEQFKAAVDKDPKYALAYTGLADCYQLLPNYAPTKEFLLQAKAYAERAIAIDDSLGEAHISLAQVDRHLWNWAAAEKEFKRGLELNPNYATGRHWRGNYLAIQGRFDEALLDLKRAQQLEPLSLVINVNLAHLYLATGDADAAVEQNKRAIDLDRDWYGAHQWLALIYMKQGRNEEALAEAEKAVELSKRQGESLGTLGYVLAQTGKRAEALQIAEELKARFTKQQANGIEIAMIYVGLKDKAETFAWLEKDFENRNERMPWRIALAPFNALRDEARYKDLRKRMKLPE
ncbi:MAG TPA: tetratricopeptide repeat protein, partial [Blastocatellia bacterium]|nr:tetratricopeptide repeat protein [Blastocatellia bacterium]